VLEDEITNMPPSDQTARNKALVTYSAVVNEFAQNIDHSSTGELKKAILMLQKCIEVID